MKRINKVLIVFIVLVGVLFGATWKLIHSKKFSSLASERVSNILTKEMGAKLSFNGLDFQMFPPATVFKNVYIEKENSEKFKLVTSIKKLTVEFTLMSFFSDDLEVDKLYIEDSNLNLKLESNNDEFNYKNYTPKKIFKEYLHAYSKSPVHLNSIIIKNMNFYINNTYGSLREFSVSPLEKEIRINGTGEKLFFDLGLKEFDNLQLDQVSLTAILERDNWNIKKLEIKKDLSTVTVSTKITDKKELQNNGVININSDFDNLKSLFPSHLMQYKNYSGIFKSKFILSGEMLEPDIVVETEINKMVTPYVKLENVKFNARKRNQLIYLDKLLVKNQIENYRLLKSQEIFDLRRKEILDGTLNFYVENAFTNTFLYSIESTMKNLKGNLTGKIDVKWNKDKVDFILKDQVQVNNFKLESDSKNPILKNNGFVLTDTVFTLERDLDLFFSARVLMANSSLRVDGKVLEDFIEVSSKDSIIDLKSFGPIGGVQLRGVGPIKLEITGPYENVKFDFDVNWNNFSVVDLNFGKVKSKFALTLRDLTLKINELNGEFNQSLFNATGFLGFGDNSQMDLKLDFLKTNFSDSRKMYDLVFRSFKLPVVPEFDFTTSYRVRGGYSLEELKINGVINGTNVTALNETADKFSLNFELENSLLLFRNIKVNKSRGEILANVSANLASNYIEIEGSANNLKLNDFNFYSKFNLQYDGDLSVEFDGNGTSENFSSRYKIKLNNAFIENVPVSASSGILYLTNDEINANGSILGGKLKVDSNLNFKTRQMSLSLAVMSADMKEFLGVVGGHNMLNKNILGRVKANISTQFNIDTFLIRNFFVDVNQFQLKEEDLNIVVDKKFNSILLENGQVKNWDMRFYDGQDFFQSQAVNGANGVIVCNQKFSIKTSVLEFLTKYIEKAVGVVKGENQIVFDKEIRIPKFSLKGMKNSIKIKGVPGIITDLEFDVVKNNTKFELSKLIGKYGEGDFKVSGQVYFDDLFPEVNLEYKIEKSNIPFFKKSNILISGFGNLKGTEFPYKLSGKINLLHGELLDDPSEFSKNGKINVDNFNKYLPVSNYGGTKGVLDINIVFDNLNAAGGGNSLLMKNSSSEVYAEKLEGQLRGNIFSPEIDARIKVVPISSKFKFKGHDFVLNQGMAEIHDNGKNRVSDLKFIGFSKINEYEMKLDISGTVDKVNINLSSEPALSQEDLLSLLTLGVTSDMSKNLEASERKFVTTVGIGSLLVDQLKINEDLNSSLGLNLSVVPEFKEDESSLVQGKSAVSESSSNRLKSSTKIKIKKKINNSMDVSVSSTVGGSLEQKQEMNVNYNFNKKWSLEGVYEVKPTTEEETNSAPTSVGADLKYKWSF